jgi:hypothetical protein
VINKEFTTPCASTDYSCAVKRALVVVALLVSPAGADRDTARAMFVQTKVTATSTFKSIDPATSLDPDQAIVGLGTSWCEGNPKSPIGESITLTFERAIAIDAVAIDNHIDSSAALGVPRGKFAHVTEVLATTNDGRKVRFAADPGGAFFATIGGGPVRALTIAITKVDRPAGVACISMIVVRHASHGNYRLFPGDPAALDPLVDGVTALYKAMSACDPKLLARLVEFPIKRTVGGHGGADDRHETITTAPKLAELCRAKQYSLGQSLDDALDRLTFESATRATLLRQAFEWKKPRWLLREVIEY